VLPLFVLVTTMIVGLLLVGRIRSRADLPVRTPFTRFVFDDLGQHYWDGTTWRPIVSRYAWPTSPPASALPH
jgi:hypothetical protein